MLLVVPGATKSSTGLPSTFAPAASICLDQARPLLLSTVRMPASSATAKTRTLSAEAVPVPQLFELAAAVIVTVTLPPPPPMNGSARAGPARMQASAIAGTETREIRELDMRMESRE